MPLINSKSKKAFSKNVEAEMEAGKPMKQSLAIAYDVQRRARKAHGGAIKNPENENLSSPALREHEEAKEACPHCGSLPNNVEGPATDISHNIRAKGEVYQEANPKQPKDSNLKGHILGDKNDRVSKIRNKMKRGE